MLDLIILLKRAKNLSRETFHEQWIAAGTALYNGPANCYIQCPVVAEPTPLAGMPTVDVSIDAIEKVTFLDQPTFAAWRASFAAQRIRLGEITEGVSVHVVKSHVVRDSVAEKNGHALLKRMVLLKRKPALTREDYFKHWFEIHAPLARKVVGGSCFYVQHQTLEEVADPHGIPSLNLNLDGFSETWYEDEDELRRAGATPEGIAVAQDNLVFGGQSKRFYFEERVIKNEIENKQV